MADDKDTLKALVESNNKEPSEATRKQIKDIIAGDGGLLTTPLDDKGNTIALLNKDEKLGNNIVDWAEKLAAATSKGNKAAEKKFLVEFANSKNADGKTTMQALMDSKSLAAFEGGSVVTKGALRLAAYDNSLAATRDSDGNNLLAITTGTSPLHDRVLGGNPAGIEKFDKMMLETNKKGQTPLELVPLNTAERLLPAMLKKGYDINAQAEDKSTPLSRISASDKQGADRAVLLIKNGAKTDIKVDGEKTVIDKLRETFKDKPDELKKIEKAANLDGKIKLDLGMLKDSLKFEVSDATSTTLASAIPGKKPDNAQEINPFAKKGGGTGLG